MITTFKIFEQLHELPNEGDYVIINKWFSKPFKTFIDQNIGQIITIEKKFRPYKYEVEFLNVPKELYNDLYDFGIIKINSQNEVIIDTEITDFVAWSENKELLEDYLISKKYNL